MALKNDLKTKLLNEAKKLFPNHILCINKEIKHFKKERKIAINLVDSSKELLQIQLTANKNGMAVFGVLEIQL